STSVRAVESAATLRVSAPTGSCASISTSTWTSSPATSSATATAAPLIRSIAPVTPMPARTRLRGEWRLSTAHRLVGRLGGRGTVADGRADADRAGLQRVLPRAERVEGVLADGDVLELTGAEGRRQLDRKSTRLNS